MPTGRRRPALRTVGALLVLMSVGASCTGETADADDRATVTADLQVYGNALVRLGYLTSVPTVRVGDCSSHRAAISWAAPLHGFQPGQTVTDLDRWELETNVLAQAGLHVWFGAHPPADFQVVVIDFGRSSGNEPAYVVRNEKGTTQLSITAAHADTVRADGYASCPSPKR